MNDLSYFDRVNLDLLRLIPRDARVIVEIGCGAGALAFQYKLSNPGVCYLGVERHWPAVERAAKRLDRVVYGDAELLTLEQLRIGPASIDCLVYGDVLEHLTDPWSLIRRHASWLRPDGMVLACVPNIQHWTVLIDLLRGRWRYQDEGLLDRTHFRFFTKESIVELFTQAGLLVDDVIPRQLPGAGYEQFQELLRPVVESLGVDANQFGEQTSAIQYVVRARRSTEPARRLLIQTAVGESLVCSRVRVHEPDQFLSTIPGVRTFTSDRHVPFLESLPGEEKILIWQRCYWRYPEDIAFHQEALRRGYLIVGEWDDDPRNWPTSTANNYFNLRSCHCLQASTEPLAALLRGHNPNVGVLPNQLAELPVMRAPSDDRFRLFFGALNRENDWQRILPGLNHILEIEGPGIHVEVVHDRAFFDALTTPHKSFEPFCPIERYVEVLRRCDVALLPLEPTPFNEMKSDLKFLECAGHGVVVLASPTVYAGSIVDGVTGLLYRSPMEFGERLRLLMSDGALRHRLAVNAHNWVRENRLLAQHYRQRYDWYVRMRTELPRLNDELRRRAPEIWLERSGMAVPGL